MTEIFDFDLAIDAQVTESVSQMNKAIKALVPQFNELRKVWKRLITLSPCSLCG